MVKVAFSRPKKNALAVLPYTRVIRFWAMLPSGSSCRVNWASTAAKSARSAKARPVTWAGAGADVPLTSWFHIRYRACSLVSPAAEMSVSSRTKRTAGGSAGAAEPGSSGANGSRPVYSRSSRNSRTLRPRVWASQPYRNTSLMVARVSGVAGPKPSAVVIWANSAPVRLNAAHSVDWWPNSVCAASVSTLP